MDFEKQLEIIILDVVNLSNQVRYLSDRVNQGCESHAFCR